jgi:alpha-beta hydrolase superfamily lysophospholipase
MTSTATFDVQSWLPPSPGPIVRGTVIVLPGRGEHAGVYERFGRRLAYDAYAVHAISVGPEADPADLRDQVAALAAEAAAPVVLAGSDTGALHALGLVVESKVDVEGLLLAATPGASASSSAFDVLAGSPEWEQELALRSSCPTHRGKLTQDTQFRRGSLFDPVPDRLRALLDLDESEYESAPPTLVLHGGADLLAPPALARTLTARLPQAELVLVAGVPHDVLNDATHRSVSGAVVQWLERLRGGAPFAPIIEHV